MSVMIFLSFQGVALIPVTVSMTNSESSYPFLFAIYKTSLKANASATEMVLAPSHLCSYHIRLTLLISNEKPRCGIQIIYIPIKLNIQPTKTRWKPPDFLQVIRPQQEASITVLPWLSFPLLKSHYSSRFANCWNSLLSHIGQRAKDKVV